MTHWPVSMYLVTLVGPDFNQFAGHQKIVIDGDKGLESNFICCSFPVESVYTLHINDVFDSKIA